VLLAAFGPAYHKATEWQRIGNQIDAAMIFARVGFRKRAASGKRHRTQHHYKQN
jgi:hypothetical protein